MHDSDRRTRWMPGMTVRQRLKELLAERGIEFSEGPAWVTVKAASSAGFDVSLHEAGELSVSFEGWHEHFADADEAIHCFMAGLSPQCRLRVTERGGRPSKWVLERECDGQWVPHSTTGLLLFRFWRSARVTYRQNGIKD